MRSKPALAEPVEADKSAAAGRIADVELEMLEALRRSRPDKVFEDPEVFRAWRWATHAPLSPATLALLERDVLQARQEGRNLIAEKFSLLAGQRAALPQAAHVDEICDVMAVWLAQIAGSQPDVVDGPVSDELWTLRCGLVLLETDTLASMRADLEAAVAAGYNLAAETFRLAATELAG